MNPKDIFLDNNQRNIKALFKGFLILLEDLQKEHEINFSKLYEDLPEEYYNAINQADYFCEEKMKYLRKKILDMGNEVIRTSDNEMEKFTITFKFME